MSTPRILVVDDNEANARVLDAILTPHGFEVLACTSGAEALERIVAEPPDVVLLDVQMPGMNGFEVCRRLREQEASALLPVVMVTSDRGQQKLEALEAGADDFVVRPFDQAELLARVRSLIRIKGYQDTIQSQAAELSEWNRTLAERVTEQVDELERLRRLRRFLSPQLAEAVLSSGDDVFAEPHRREIAVLFCDLRGFTAFAAVAEPEEVLGALAAFHDALGVLVTRHDATVGYFAGDGVMLFFNDPLPCDDPAGSAVDLALELRDAMTDQVERWEQAGHRLGVAAAVSYGFATLGLIGFEGRYDYSAIGSVVNLAARLCDKAAAGEVIIDRRAHAAVADSADCESIGELDLAGLPAPVPAWRVTGRRAGTVAAPPGSLEFQLLGPLEITAAGRPVDMPGGKERALLALLLIHANRPVSAERLAEDLWEGNPPDSAASALRVYISRLRRSLGQASTEEVLQTRAGGYELRVDPEAIDAARFERMVADGQRVLADGDPVKAGDILRAALDLWRGPALTEVAGAPHAAAEATRLDEVRLAALEDRIEADLAAGRHRELVGELEALVGATPLRERLWGQRMLALYRCGRQAEALRAYQDLRTLLSEELGLSPSPALADLERSILAQDPALLTTPG